MRAQSWNPWTLLRTMNPLFYLAYAGSAILIGIAAVVFGVVLFPVLPAVAGWVADLERNRVSLLGLPPIPDPDPHGSRRVWLWDGFRPGTLGLWGASAGFFAVDAVSAAICAVTGLTALMMIYTTSVRLVLAGVVVLAIGIVLTLLAAAAVSGWQASTVLRLTAPRPDLAGQVAALTSSRLRLVDTFEHERRRIERELHDGAQQYLVASGMKVGEAAMLLDQAARAPYAPERELLHRLAALLATAQDDSDAALRALRETVAGIHPKVLSDRGLEAAIRDVAGRHVMPVTVSIPYPLPKLPEALEATAYFLVTEALTNVAKYAPQASAVVALTAASDLRLTITDSGPGGAVLAEGHGLDGLRERFATFGGVLEVDSPLGGPTRIVGRLPLPSEEAA